MQHRSYAAHALRASSSRYDGDEAAMIRSPRTDGKLVI
jgi:hypothetical protein